MTEYTFGGTRAPNGDHIVASLWDRETFAYQFALRDKDDVTLLAGRYRQSAVNENPSNPNGGATVSRFIVEEARIPSRKPGQPYHLGNDLPERMERFADFLTVYAENEIRRFRSINANRPEAERPNLPRYELIDNCKGGERLLRLLATPERVS